MGRKNSMLNLMEGIIPEFDRKGVVRSPSGSSVTGIVPTGAYPCAPSAPSASADADTQPEYVIIGANADSMYERLMQVMDRADLTGPEFANNQHRVKRRVEIEDAIVAWTRQRTRDEVLRELDQVGVPAGRVATVRDIFASEQVRERVAVEDVWVPGQVPSNAAHGEEKYEDGGWMVKMPGVAPRLEGVQARTRWAGPDLGAHNREILCGKLGLSAKELNALVENGTVGVGGK
jgi:crotonobetainyl-CoA:carnitine CoA-transferase CaiB-like acyl-CoA transferase